MNPFFPQASIQRYSPSLEMSENVSPFLATPVSSSFGVIVEKIFNEINRFNKNYTVIKYEDYIEFKYKTNGTHGNKILDISEKLFIETSIDIKFE